MTRREPWPLYRITITLPSREPVTWYRFGRDIGHAYAGARKAADAEWPALDTSLTVEGLSVAEAARLGQPTCTVVRP